MNANSEFSIRFMRRVAIVFFELGAVKRHFIIVSLFQNCALLKVLNINRIVR